MKIIALLPVRNEAWVLHHSLTCLSAFCDVVLVNDQASEDASRDICRHYPYLNLAQVHAALTYYYDHQQEMDQEIDRRWRRAAEIKERRADSAIQDKLRQLGHLP